MADLLDVATVARHMRLDDYRESQTLISELIDAAQAAIERETNRTLDTACQYVEYHTGMVLDGYGCIFVDHPPISATTAPVVYDDRRYSPRLITSTDTIRDTDDGGLNYGMGKLQLWNNEGYFSSDKLNVQITYWGGWTTATLPRDVKLAWIELVQFWFENPERVGLKYSRDGSYGAAIEEAEIPKQLLAVFHSYRVQSVRVGW